MSFLLDVVLILIALIVAWIYAKRSIFSALTGMASVVVAVIASLFLSGLLAPVLSEYVVAPLVEQSAANELADMFSAPHLSGGRETVEQLSLDSLVFDEPEAYQQLLSYYGVSASEVREAYWADRRPETVLIALTADCAQGLSTAAAFSAIMMVLFVLLRLIFRRIEENFPPLRRYRGFRKAAPCLIGIVNGLVWSWATAQVLSQVLSATAGMQVFFTSEVLQKTDCYRLLTMWNPFLAVQNLFT